MASSSIASSAAAAAAATATAVSTITMPVADDFHLHVRDGDVMQSVIFPVAERFGRAIIMPNLKPAVTTTAMALEYRDRIRAALARECKARAPLAPDVEARAMAFTPMMTLYLTDHTTPGEIARAKASGHIYACKLYPAGATTNSAAGVTDLTKLYPTLEAMSRAGLLLLVHGEVTPDTGVDIFDREKQFIERHLKPLRKAVPALKIVMEHITTRDAAEYVRSNTDGRLAATITAHHLLYNRNAIFSGGINPHLYCLPILKREEHRVALIEAATSGDPRFFAGTDSAPHPKTAKEAACGCAGCYTSFAALELYAEAFDAHLSGAVSASAAGAVVAAPSASSDVKASSASTATASASAPVVSASKGGDLQTLLRNFLCVFGADFYGLPKRTTETAAATITLKREVWKVPAEMALGSATVVPLRAGQTIAWKISA